MQRYLAYIFKHAVHEYMLQKKVLLTLAKFEFVLSHPYCGALGTLQQRLLPSHIFYVTLHLHATNRMRLFPQKKGN